MFEHPKSNLKKLKNIFLIKIIYMTNIKQPRLHNIHVRNISGEIDDNNVDTNAKLNSWN
jgi:hypothetical protein